MKSNIKSVIVLMAATLCVTTGVRATTLVYEGFHTSDYTTSTATALKDTHPTGHNIGFSSADVWAGGTSVPKSTATTLTASVAFDASEESGTGKAVIQYSGTENKGRGIYRRFSAQMPSDGIVYLRFLMKLNANVSDYTGVLQSGNYFAGGFVQNTFNGGQDAFRSLTTDGIWMGYKRTSVNGTAALSLFARIGATDYLLPLNTVNSSPLLSTWSTYIFVARVRIGAGTGGRDLVDIAAQPIASTAYDPNWTWDVANIEANIVSGGTPISYIAFGGQYQTNNKEVFIDQYKIATTLAEVCNHNSYVEPSSQSVSVISTSVANVTTASADLSATIGMVDVASATPSVAYGTAADVLSQTNTLTAITASGTVTHSLTGLDPLTTYYYRWTVAAAGVDPAESSVASFVTKGAVVFGDVATGGLPSTGGVWASVNVGETGIGTTSVSCLCGETAESMSVIGTWADVRSGENLVATNSAAAWGKAYFFKFVATFEYDGETYSFETPAANRTATALDHLKATASGDWMDGANWSLGVPPSDMIAATISNVTTMASLYLEDMAATVKSLTVKMGKATVDLRGGSSMTIGSITFGDKNIQNSDGGEFVTTGGVVTVNGNVAPAYQARTNRNKLEINGTEMTINGSLSTDTRNDSGFYNDIHVYNGSTLTITNGLTVSYAGTMVVDASVVTNKKNLVVASLAKSGTLTLKNGAYFRQPWASTTGVGGKGEGTLNILNGSTFDASGATFYFGSDGDGSWNNGTLFVSNSTFKTGSFISPRHTKFLGTYTISVEGPDALFQVTDDATLGAVNMTASSYRTSGSTRMNVNGGFVKIDGWLNVGGGNFDCAMNYLTVSGATARMELGTLNCRTNATVKFVVPETGFGNAAIIHATNTVSLATGMPSIQIDATECRECPWTSLLAADKGISNLTAATLEERVALVEKDGHKTVRDHPYEFRLLTDNSTVKALQFRVVGDNNTVILLR